ncbi:MAG: hypothetical protein ABIO48_08915 [Pedococcus sp.]|jgi:hypothetical protein
MNTTKSTKTWIGRILCAGAAVAASVVLATSSAQAYIPPSPSYYAGTPSAVQTSLYCGGGQIVIAPLVAVQSNWVNGQFAVYRYTLVSGGRTIQTSGWSTAKYLPYTATSMGATYTYARSPLPATTLNVTPGHYWEVAVQVGWYLGGSSWSYSQWMVPEGYTSNRAGLAITNTGWRPCNS